MTDNTIVYNNRPARGERVRPLYRSTQIVWYVFYAIETILLFRFVLKLLGANSGAAFTQFVYGLSEPFVAPFRYVFGSPSVFGSTIEWSTLLAMLVYWILAWGIVRAIAMSRPVSESEAGERVARQDFAE